MDVFAEAEGLKRRRALLERLQQQASNPQIQGPRGMAIAQLLASLATQHNTAQKLKGLDSAEAGNRQQYGEQLGSELEQYMQRQEGAPGAPAIPGAPPVAEVAPGMPGMNLGGLPGIPQVNELPAGAPQPRQAVFNAIASRFPEMQAVGKAGLSELLKKPPAPPKPDNWNIAPDGTPYRTGPNGEFITGAGKFPKADKPLVNIDNFPKAEEKAAEAQHTQVLPGGEMYKRAEGGKNLITAGREAVNAYQLGASSGTFEPFFQGVRGVISRFTGADPKTINTDVLGSRLADITLAASGGTLGAGFSNADREFVEKSKGSLNMQPEAVRRLLAISMAAAIKSQFQYQRALKTVVSRGGAFAGAADFAVEMDHGLPDDPEFVQMVENVLVGKPSTAGIKAGPAEPPPGPAVTPQSRDPRIRFKPTGG